MNNAIRIGYGFDVHRFAPDRKLILGGIEIPFEMGLLGHSDADVLLHAIIDAILGALALGDIGRHFPDTSEEFKNADSTMLLKKVMEMVYEKEYRIGNIDSTVILEMPKLLPYISEMRKKIANLLRVNLDSVSVKATTSEKMGFIGRQEGIKAVAVALLVENTND